MHLFVDEADMGHSLHRECGLKQDLIIHVAEIERSLPA